MAPIRADDWHQVVGLVSRRADLLTFRRLVVQGASKNQNLMEWDKLWTINKRIIDPVCPRHTAVILEAKVLLTLSNGPQEPIVRVRPLMPP